MENEMEIMHGAEWGNRSWRRMGSSEIEVSNDGHVKGRVVTRGEYCSFSYHKTMYVHRVVYELFVGPIPEGYDINHIDGNKHNNGVSNLEPLSRSGNQKHAVRMGLHPVTKTYGADNGRYKGGVAKIANYGRLWYFAKKKGLDWKNMSKDERLALLPEIDNGATFQMIK